MVVSHVQMPLSYLLWVNVGEFRKCLHGSLDCYLCLDDLKCSEVGPLIEIDLCLGVRSTAFPVLQQVKLFWYDMI